MWEREKNKPKTLNQISVNPHKITCSFSSLMSPASNKAKSSSITLMDFGTRKNLISPVSKISTFTSKKEISVVSLGR